MDKKGVLIKKLYEILAYLYVIHYKDTDLIEEIIDCLENNKSLDTIENFRNRLFQASYLLGSNCYYDLETLDEVYNLYVSNKTNQEV